MITWQQVQSTGTLHTLKTGWDTNLTLLNVWKIPAAGAPRNSAGVGGSTDPVMGKWHSYLACPAAWNKKAPQVHHFGQHGHAARSRILIKLVNSGTRLLERTEHMGLPFPFRLAQEGVHCIAPLMSKQLLFAPRDDIEQLLTRHSLPIHALRNDALRAAAAACKPGCCAIVLDEHGANAFVPGARPLLVLAAMRRRHSQWL